MSTQQHNRRMSLFYRTSVRRHVSVIASSALIATGLVAGIGISAHAAPASSPSAAEGQSLAAGQYIITLAGAPVAGYAGGIAGFAATKTPLGSQLDANSAAAQAYSAYLKKQQLALTSSIGVRPFYNFTMATNGFAATLTAAQVKTLTATPGVVAIERDSAQQLDAQSSTDFLGLEGEGGVWQSIGGTDAAGEGIILGVLDTGIAPENPSFAGSPLGSAAGADPYYSSPIGEVTYVKADGNTYVGRCEIGAEFALTDCSTKIVGARSFPTGFAAAGGTPASGEYLSPRDGNNHGSHTASTAAGNFGVETTVAGKSYGAISGVAPAAKIAAYKVCWTGAALSTCLSTDTVAAIDKAVEDGVDVLTFSIGGGAATTTVSATGRAFLGAATAGIFVSASAGNSGPGASTLDNAAPWITTVGASTIPSYESTVVLGDGTSYAGASITVNAPLTGALITAPAASTSGAATLCQANELDPALATGKIVVCERGVSARADKSAEVLRAGGIGMILVNPTSSSVDLDTHSVPTVHVDAPFRDAIWNYAGFEGATATLVEGNQTAFTPPTPQMAGFSSRGPVLADGSDLLKPDITAPGVAILAASANADDAAPTWMFMSGTSMSAPHVAGIGLLYLGVHPNASPSEVKSAMMTTAYNTLDAAGNTVTDPFAQGAGHADPTKLFRPGFVYLNGASEWASYMLGTGYTVDDPDAKAVDASDLNLSSLAIGSLTETETLTRTVTSTQAGTFTATVNEMPGIRTTVFPSEMTFTAAGETTTYTVTFERITAPLDVWVTGSLDWVSDAHSGSVLVHSPMAVRPVAEQPAQPNKSPLDNSGILVTPGTSVVTNWMLR